MGTNVILYILLALIVLLIILVVFLTLSLSKIRDNIKQTNKKNEENSNILKDSLKNDIKNVSDNMWNIQKTMQSNLNERLSGTFESINKHLESMNQGLGEMKNAASSIEDVKKVLTNVKSRGILGEIQLGSILRDILAPNQYELNVVTVPGSSNRVEFAVKLPSEAGNIYLPIDSKFPGDAYAHLLDAYESADEFEVKSTKSVLINQFKKEAKDISEKYIKVPYTTDFGIMFLPFEGLYAEAVNLGMIEILQNQYHVVLAGPSTMAALLNSLQMGFRTLAIQENAEKVWTILGKVKSEFNNFADVLSDTQKSLEKTSDNLEKLVGTRTRKIQAALKDVECIEGVSLEDPINAEYYIGE